MLSLFKGNTSEALLKELHKNKIDKTKIEKLIDSGLDINSTDGKGRSVLFSLVAKKKIDSIKILIEKGIDLNLEDNYGHTVLNDAMSRSDGLMIRFLLDNGISVNHINSSGRTIFHDAALEENFKVIQILMKYRPDFNIKDFYGKTVLFDAVEGANVGIIREVINHIDNINLVDAHGQTVLFNAVLKDNPEVTQLLVSHGLDVNIVDNKKQNALFNAVVKGSFNIDIVNILIDKNIKINQVDITNKNIIDEILYIIELKRESKPELEGKYKLIDKEHNYSELVSLLVENGLAINKLDKKGKTTLSKEIEKQNYKNIEFLIDCGADINVKDSYGRTALFEAVKKGQSFNNMIDFLIENGADIENRNVDGKTIIDDLVEMTLFEKGLKKLDTEYFRNINKEGHYEEILKRLFKYKPNLDIKRADGRTTIFDVITYNDFETIRLLFNYGVDPNTIDNEGNTPLSLMVDEGLKIEKGREREAFIERLVFVLKFRVNVDLQDHAGRTVFHKAVLADDLTVVEKLLTKKSDLSIKDKQGRTALHHTQWKGNYKIARWLIASGSNMDEPDYSGFTLLNYAAILGHTKLVLALIVAGVLMYNKNKKSKKVAQFFKDREGGLQKLFKHNIPDEKMKHALDEVCENLKKEVNEALEG